MTAFLEPGRRLKLNSIHVFESTAVNIGFLMTSCTKVANSVVFCHDYSDISLFFRTHEAVQVAPCMIPVNN